MTDLLSDLKALVAKYDATAPDPQPDPVPIPDPQPVPVPDPTPIPTPTPAPLPKATASTAAELAAALKAAQPGDTITLAGGDYGALKLASKAGLTIASADPKNPPRFTAINATGCSALVLSGLSLAGNDGSSLLTTLRLDGCKGAVVRGCQIDAANIGVSAGAVVYVIKSQDVEIDGNRIRGGHETIMLVDSDRITVTGNSLSDFGAVAVRGGGDNDVLIDSNDMRRATSPSWPLGDHGDYIHLWTKPARGVVSNVTITNNLMDQDSGNPIMGISLQITGGHSFANVVIGGNLILSDNAQAMRLEGINGGRIVGNTMVPTCAKGPRQVGGTTIWVGEAKLMLVGGSGVTVDRNIYGAMPRAGAVLAGGANLGITFADLAKVFTNPTGRAWADFIARADGPGAGLGIH